MEMAELTPTIGLLELLWTAIFVIALGFNLWGLEDAHHDLRALREAGARNGRLLVALQNRRNEACRVYTSGVFLTVGILAMATQPPIVPELAAFALTSQVLFLTVAFVLVFQSALDHRDRGRKLRAIRVDPLSAGALAEDAQETADDARGVAGRVQGAADRLREVADGDAEGGGAPRG